MSTSPTVTAAFRQQFHDDFMAAVQQSDSRFANTYVNRGMINGSSFTIQNVGTSEMQPVTGRYQDKVPQAVEHAVRVAWMADYDNAVVLDSFDKVKMTADPMPRYVADQKSAANRRIDKTVYRALLDPVLQRTAEGQAGSNVALPAGQQIVAGGTGLTKAKIIQAKSLFRRNEADKQADNNDDLFILYDDNAMRQILSDTTLTSADYMAGRMLENGEVLRNWLGFTWIPYQALDVPAANTARSVAWSRSAVHFGTGIDVKTWVGENTNKRGHPVESYVWMSLGAGRQDEKKVVQIDFATNV
jgi:hypothetical protein